MAGSRGSGRPKGPKPGAILTGMVVGEAKKGVLVELGSTELLLARSRWGAAADRLAEAGYGDAVTVEVVAGPGGSGVALDRIGIERSIRQPRAIEAELRRTGSGFELRPADGSPAFNVVVLDRMDPDALAGTQGSWSVGAPYRDLRFVLPPS